MAHFPVTFQSRPVQTCCRGCQAVAQAILDHGFADYYTHRTALPQNPETTLPEFLRQIELYDHPEIQRSFVHSEGEHVREAALLLEGIRCAACVWLNEQHLARLPGVLSVDINYTTRRARVRWDARRIQLSDILRAIAAIGYSAHPFDASRQEDLRRRERATALRRLAIAGLSMMQVMMYALPTYMADADTMSGDIESLMRWASLLLTLPVMLYSAWPFVAGAWRDLRLHRLGMDVPVALGIWVAFLASAYATVTGGGEVYFDSVAMFVFLLLGGRYLEMNARERAADAVDRLARLVPSLATRYVDAAWTRTEDVAVAALAPGDHVLVRPGAPVPADGVVVSGRGSVDESLLTGESRPIAKQPGDAVVGGALNTTSPLVIRVTQVGQDTVLSGMLRLLDRAQAEKPRLALLADRAAHGFVLAILFVAAATALVWWFVEPARALWIAVSVLVATCPCALSLATPTALTAATGALMRRGLLITRGHVLETLARATDVVFDKTGTLTLGRMVLLQVQVLRGTRTEALRLAAVLEQGSEHPLARALRQEVGTAPVPVATDMSNQPGRGIEGCVGTQRIRVGSIDFVAELAGPCPVPVEADNATLVGLGDASGWIALFRFGDSLRPDAVRTVRALEALGKRVHLLSGDRPAAAAAAATALGIGAVRGGASPADKLAYVRALQDAGAVVAMVGDGINDAPVLAQAQVSLAMGSGTAVAQAAADLVIMGGQLGRVAEAARVAKRTLRIIRQNLAWALGYNLIVLPPAMLGYVTPWMAGLGMSLSSLLVVLNALRLTDERAPWVPAVAAPRLSAAGG